MVCSALKAVQSGLYSAIKAAATPPERERHLRKEVYCRVFGEESLKELFNGACS